MFRYFFACLSLTLLPEQVVSRRSSRSSGTRNTGSSKLKPLKNNSKRGSQQATTKRTAAQKQQAINQNKTSISRNNGLRGLDAGFKAFVVTYVFLKIINRNSHNTYNDYLFNEMTVYDEHDYASSLEEFDTERDAKEIITEMAEQGVDFQELNGSGQAPIHLLAMEGQKDILEILLEQENVDINQKDLSGQTAIYMAALNGHVETYDFLFSKNASTLDWNLLSVLIFDNEFEDRFEEALEHMTISNSNGTRNLLNDRNSIEETINGESLNISYGKLIEVILKKNYERVVPERVGLLMDAGLDIHYKNGGNSPISIVWNRLKNDAISEEEKEVWQGIFDRLHKEYGFIGKYTCPRKILCGEGQGIFSKMYIFPF